MKALLIGLFVVILAIGGAFFYWNYYVTLKSRKLSDEKYRMVAPLIQKVRKNEKIEASEIIELARNPSLRHGLYVLLKACERLDLFPTDYMTYEKGAEGCLVSWLEFPTELGTPPDEIEYIQKVTLQDNGEAHYYAFRYRMMNVHWATEFGWMIGVAGPYRSDTMPYDIPGKVFSRFKIAEQTSCEAEVAWVHANVNRT
jgi:hypothetical protein